MGKQFILLCVLLGCLTTFAQKADFILHHGKIFTAEKSHNAVAGRSHTIEEAVTAYTAGSVYAEFKEKEKGTLVKGKLADLSILSQDIFTVPLPQLPATQSVLTVIGGKIVHDAKSN